MLKKFLLSLLIFLSLACIFPSCSDQVDPAKSQAVVVLTFKGKGIVKAINKDKQKITLDHEVIKDYMEPMVMDFSVAEKSMLDNLVVGDKVEFTLKHEAGIDTVTEIRKVS